MGRLLWLAAALGAAGCGSIPNSQPDAAPKDTIDSITITGKAKLSWTLSTKLTATANFHSGKTLDVSTATTWSSDASSIATIAPDGTVTAVAKGAATIHAMYEGQDGTLPFTVTMPTLAVSSYAGQRIDFFPADANGEVPPLYSIPDVTPPGLTTFTNPRTLFVYGDELFLADQGAQAIDVFPLTAMGNVAPTRQIKGAATMLGSPSQIFVTANEIYVADGSASILIFPRTGTGNIAPTRTFTSAALSNTRGVVVVDNEVYVASYGTATISVYPANATGTVTPTRTLSGPLPLLGGPQGMLVVNHELFSGGSSGAINVYDAAAMDNTPPIRRIAGANTKLAYTDELVLLGHRLYSSNYSNSTVQVFDITASGDAMPIASIGGPMTKIASTLGIALFGVDQ